jgi:hypothetical protein
MRTFSRSLMVPASDAHAFVVVESDGIVWMIMRQTAVVDCPMDVQRFPYDTPKCSMNYMATEYDSDRLLMSTMSTGVNTQFYEQNTGECYARFGCAHTPRV